jgi:hypothetical protein
VLSVGFLLSNLLSIACWLEINEVLPWRVRRLELINHTEFGKPLKANPGEFRNQRDLTMGWGDCEGICVESLSLEAVTVDSPGKRTAVNGRDDRAHRFTVLIVRRGRVIIGKTGCQAWEEQSKPMFSARID